MHYHFCKAKLHELAIYDPRVINELVPPFNHQTESPTARSSQTAVHPLEARATFGILDSCHGILNAMLGVDDSILRGCPSATFAECLYAIKLLNIVHQALQNPQHILRHVVDEKYLQYPYFVGALTQKLKDASGPMFAAVPHKILSVVVAITRAPAKAAGALTPGLQGTPAPDSQRTSSTTEGSELQLSQAEFSTESTNYTVRFILCLLFLP